MEHDFDFDPTHGHDLDALLAVGCPEPVADFEAFWRDTYDQARAVPPRPTLRRVDEREGQVVYEIAFDAWGDVRLGGWLTVPVGVEARDIQRGVVVGHGYGGRQGPELNVPGPPAIVLFPCARGFDRSARPDLPDVSARHVLHGITSRDTYIHRGCAADLWAAASALLELHPQVADCLDYLGGSFGGGIGALALPWDERFRRVALYMPSFGNHPLRITLPCTGSGEAVRRYHHRRPETNVLAVLAYFDAAVAARWLRQPTLCACALFDPSVPPPGQFAVYNALAGPRQLVVRQAGHFGYAEEAADNQAQHDATARWFAADELAVR
ncbi:MAG: acetylxylan esterase [Phycisphaeraceae bacterium]